jgi:hypothetical protein
MSERAGESWGIVNVLKGIMIMSESWVRHRARHLNTQGIARKNMAIGKSKECNQHTTPYTEMIDDECR